MPAGSGDRKRGTVGCEPLFSQTGQGILGILAHGRRRNEKGKVAAGGYEGTARRCSSPAVSGSRICSEWMMMLR